jgi:sugar phosphate permease
MLSAFIKWMKPLPDAKATIQDKKAISATYKLWRCKVFLGTYIGYVAYYFTRKNLSSAAPDVIKGLNINKEQYGAFGSVMYITYGIGKFLSGMLSDKCNTRNFMALGLIGSSIINMLFPFIYSVPWLTFLWGLNGGFQSMGFPPVAKTLVNWFSPNERATKWTLWSSSHTVGTYLAGILVICCISISSWKAAFFIPGVIGLIVGFILFFMLMDRPSCVGLPSIDVYKNDTIKKSDMQEDQKKSNINQKGLLKKYVFCNPYLWALGIAYTFIYFIRFATLDWATIFMTERGIPEKVAMFYLTFMPLIGTLGGITSGWISDKFFKGCCTPTSIIYLLCLIFSLWGMYTFTSATSPGWCIVTFLSLVGFFVDGPQNLVGGVQVSRVTVAESVGAAVGFAGMFGYIGAAFSGKGTAWIDKYWGWSGVFLTCGVFCVLAIFFISLTWKKEASLIKKNVNK